ncbi:MAG: phosphatidylserine decarboxylase family protein [Cytophagales bacterium]|nr:phosphatidylserine decarboxylase family protein [Cytophagales bacterium]MDW8383384.1 phosphatidylserine decarboxylase family protein [Flammeovirgaceae bacterium]
MTIHREGYATLLIVLIVLTILYGPIEYFYPENLLLQRIAMGFCLIVFLFFLQFFRNPNRNVFINENYILAPADGKVVVIEETQETEYFADKRIQISIFMSPFDVHLNRNPIKGVVKMVKYHPGKYLVAWHPKSSIENERTTIVIQHENGKEILIRQIAGAIARRICWYVQENQIVQQGSELGFIKFGSRVDIFLPLDAKINVELNQKTIAGETIIAMWN